MSKQLFKLRAISLLLAIAFLLVFPAATCSQAPDSVLTKIDRASIDLVALHTARKIQEAKLTDEPSVLVVDFFRGSAGTSSALGTLLADRFSESLSNSSRSIKVMDRRILSAYLTKNWATLEDLSTIDVCLRIGRVLGATGVITGTLFEENGQIGLRVHLEGFGRVDKETDDFRDSDELARLALTEQTKEMLFRRGPNYSRTSDEIPDEPGILKYGTPGVSPPRCIECPDPAYTDAARAAKYQGTVRLSVVVTSEGKVTSIYVLKGAPFLTDRSIKTVQTWRLRPAEQNGKPVSVRTEIETMFRLF